MKPTNDEKLQVVEGLLKMGESLNEAIEVGDQKLLLQALASSNARVLTALAMILVADTASPKMEEDRAQLLLFQESDADEQPPQDGY
jgi:hypothetical protein